MATTINNRIRFMNNNHAQLTTGQITFSSELAAFPQSNVINPFRSKVWRPSGRFEVRDGTGAGSANNLLYINDGADKTVTLTTGDYITPDILATEIQTQLNTVSTGWTVTYNATSGDYRFKISHASNHVLKVSSTTDAFWDDLGFIGSVDLTISTEIYADEQRNHTSEFVTYDLGYNASIQFFAVIAPLNVEFPFSTDATITLSGNNLDQWDSPPLQVTLTPTIGGIMRFLDDIEDTGYRYWRFEYQDKQNTEGPTGVQLSYMYLGTYTTLTDRNISNGFEKTIVDPSEVQESENGSLYFDERTKYAVFRNAGIQYLNKTDRDTLEQLYHDFGLTTPLFISLDPTTCVSNDLYDLTKYMVFSRDPGFKHVIRDLFNMTLNFREVV